MFNWATFYALLTAVVVAVVYVRRQRSRDALGAVIVLALLCFATNVGREFLHINEPYNTYFPILDSGAALAFAWGWRNRLEPWKIALLLLFVADGFLHVAYLAEGDTSYGARYDYDLRLNLLYIVQLLCVVSATFSTREVE